MLAKSNFFRCLVLLLLFFAYICDGGKTKYKRKVGVGTRWHNILSNDRINTRNDTGRGLFFRGGLLSFSKVVNFFPVGGERECQPEGYNVARAGICLNAYDCRQRDGRAAGDCAHGLGVCCVFETSCGGVVQNNLTYFMSPGFPELWGGEKDCNITIEKTYAGIIQLRIDFLHFTIGQPNRITGDCDEDAMILGDGETKFTMCGQNHGQHIYYTLSTSTSPREAGDLPTSKATTLSMRMRSGEMPRLWLMRIAQLPLVDSAPHNCLQYYTADNGTIKTFNYASNGRHLSNQDYRTCVRRNKKYCSIRYSPCDQRSFRIGSGEGAPAVIDPVVTNSMMPVQNAPPQEDEMEGSGDDPQIESTNAERPGFLANRSSRSRLFRWSPYIQHYSEDDNIRYFGYGNFGAGLNGFGRQRCGDRVTIPCENEYFVSSEYYNVGVCDPHHCGNTFCPGQSINNCWVETSITPFAVSIHFGPPTIKKNPEENIGMCLKYHQIPCDN